MFQEASLPWRRVIDNVTSGCRPSRARGECWPRSTGRAAREWPARLSGGQRQRRRWPALVHRPRLLLLDSRCALDALTRIEMHRLIEGLWLRHRFTALLVTHDVQEAVALADR